jgi:hypothetical protein
MYSYLRKQITFLDPKWTVQLRFLLGTKFDELFIGEQARGQMTRGETARLSVQGLEKFLKERIVHLMSLVKFMEDKAREGRGKGQSPRLDILYEAAFDGIQIRRSATNGQLAWLAHFASPEIVNRDGGKFNANLLRIRSKKYEKEEGINEEEALAKARAKMLDEIVSEIETNLDKKSGEKIKKRDKVERAKHQMEGNKIARRKLPNVPFDFLVCAGGANDQIRDRYFGLWRGHTICDGRKYGAASKDRKLKNLNRTHFDRIRSYV